MTEEQQKEFDEQLLSFGVAYFNKIENKVIPTKNVRRSANGEIVFTSLDWSSRHSLVRWYNVDDFIIEELYS